jgi:hypothetical protein
LIYLNTEQSIYTCMRWHDAALINSKLKCKKKPHAQIK